MRREVFIGFVMILLGLPLAAAQNEFCVDYGFSVTAIATCGLGLTTNFTDIAPSQFVCQDSTTLRWIDRAGSSLASCSFPTWVTGEAGIATNASGTSVTEFFLFDNADGQIVVIDDACNDIRNITLSSNPGNDAYGLAINVSNQPVDYFYIIDQSPDQIWVFDADGTNVRNITLSNLGAKNGYKLVSNTSNSPNPTFFTLLSESGEDLRLGFINSSGYVTDMGLVEGVSSAVAAALWVNSSQARTTYVEIGTGLTADMQNMTLSENGVQFQVQQVNNTYVDYNGGVNLTVQVRGSCRVDTIWLETNETGVFENKTASYGSETFLNVSTLNQTDYIWTNSSVGCDKLIQLKVFANNSEGYESATSAFNIALMPYLNTSIVSGITKSSSSCTNSTHLQVDFTGTGIGNFTFNMPVRKEGTTDRCSYYAYGVDRIRLDNYTDRCDVTVNLTTKTETPTIKISGSPYLKTTAPSNLPAALGAAAVGVIIVIYTVTRRRRSSR